MTCGGGDCGACPEAQAGNPARGNDKNGVRKVLNRERNFKFLVENVKVNMNASESSLLFARFTRSPKRPIEKKGEKAKVLFLINDGLTASKVTELERHCRCEERDSSPMFRNRLRNPGDCQASLAMTPGNKR
jgi:hypothetical protein